MIAKLNVPFFDNNEENSSELLGTLIINNSCTESYAEAVITIKYKDKNSVSICLDRFKFVELYNCLGSMLKSDKETINFK